MKIESQNAVQMDTIQFQHKSTHNIAKDVESKIAYFTLFTLNGFLIQMAK